MSVGFFPVFRLVKTASVKAHTANGTVGYEGIKSFAFTTILYIIWIIHVDLHFDPKPKVVNMSSHFKRLNGKFCVFFSLSAVHDQCSKWPYWFSYCFKMLCTATGARLSDIWSITFFLYCRKRGLEVKKRRMFFTIL